MGLTQSEFADLLGVSYASVNRWENGQSQPSVLAWQKIAAVETTNAASLSGVRVPARYETMESPKQLEFCANPETVGAT